MTNLCETSTSKYVGNIITDVCLIPCGCGEEVDLGCLSNLAVVLDNTEITEEQFQNCKSEIIETLKGSVNLDIIGQHNPKLLDLFYGAQQSEQKGTYTKSVKGCFGIESDKICIPFMNIDDSEPVVTLPDGITADITSEVVEDELRGTYTKYYLENPAGANHVFGECFNFTVEVTGYDMTNSELCFGRGSKKKFILKLKSYEPQENGVPKVNVMTFSDVTFNSSLSLPFIDGENGFTRSTLTFDASDKSKLNVCAQSCL